jgi:hypothetical protein
MEAADIGKFLDVSYEEPTSGTLPSSLRVTWKCWDCITAQTGLTQQDIDRMENGWWWNPPPKRHGEPIRVEEGMIIS